MRTGMAGPEILMLELQFHTRLDPGLGHLELSFPFFPINNFQKPFLSCFEKNSISRTLNKFPFSRALMIFPFVKQVLYKKNFAIKSRQLFYHFRKLM